MPASRHHLFHPAISSFNIPQMGISKTVKFPAGAKTSLYVVTATGLAFQAATTWNFSLFSHDSPPVVASHFPERIRAGIDGVVRSSRAISTIAFAAADYKYSLRGLAGGSEDYLRQLSEVHLRSAKSIRKLCETNKGFYVKAGQFVAAMKQVPKEYSATLSSLRDQAVPYDFEAVKEVVINNLGHNLSEIFLSFDEEPIAAASIAQVHRAVLKGQKEVAVKVQYPGLKEKMKLDMTIMSFLSKSIAWLFPEYRFGWLISEFRGVISLELDFVQEAKNSQRMADNLKHNILIRVPRDLTTSQVLTMQFCRGKKVDDIEFMKEMNIDPVKVANVLVEAFAEMIFVHGFVHGDPHPGNILVCPDGPSSFSLVLLDHGICRKLDAGFRQDYCQLWKALIHLDSHKIQDIGDRFGVGKYARFFPLIFTGRTIDSKSALGKGMSIEEKQKLKQELTLLKMEDISSFMESLPPDFLAVLRTDGLLRSIISNLGASQRMRLLAYAKHALYGVSSKTHSDDDAAAPFSRAKFHFSYLRLRLVLELMELFDGLKKLKQSIFGLCQRMSSSLRSARFSWNLFSYLIGFGADSSYP